MENRNKPEHEKRVFIIDGMSCVYRAFHAIPGFTTSGGLPTNAVYGFVQTLRKLIKTYSPEFICIAFDVKGPTFRHELYEEYKVHRPPMPDTLSPQIPYIKNVVRAMKIPVIEQAGFEADDIIATLAKRFSAEQGPSVVIVTGDKDMFQLVGPETTVLDAAKVKQYGPDEVKAKLGVLPHQVVDFMALAGDPSDNIPGVPGVGVKTAAKLIDRFGSLDNIYENLADVSGVKLREKLKANKDLALLSRTLATLHTDVPFDCPLDELKLVEPDYDSLEALFKELEFSKLIKDMIPARRVELNFKRVSTRAGILDLVSKLYKADLFSITLSRQGEGINAPAAGIAVSTGPGDVWFVPLGQTGEGEEGIENEAGLDEVSVLEQLRRVFADEGVKKATDDAKALIGFLLKRGLDIHGIIMDTGIASYLLDPVRSGHTLAEVAYDYLGLSLGGDGDDGDDDGADAAACEGVLAIMKLTAKLGERLEADGLKKLFFEMELPVARILARMELTGVRIDVGILEGFSRQLKADLDVLESAIYESAGTQFNINSPKQLSVVLFETLGLKPVKKTKTGYSTNESVLNVLADHHEVPRKIIQYRQLAKLRSTFVDALIALVNPETGRIHASFNQTVTATGRLSSSRPNLQNIPVRADLPCQVREAFVARDGFVFLSGDYSQIELRIVAHLAKDPVLMAAFSSGEDVHTRTASEVFSVLPGLVTPELRRRAKAINFGIIYGMGPYGLAAELGISMADAGAYIDAYLAHYSGVREFIGRVVDEATKRGYTETIFGRRRYIPELKAADEPSRKFGERMAINTPVQGSAADIVKAAMIRIDQRITEAGLGSRLILQIHDELIYEVPTVEIEQMTELVKEEMEGAVELDVPLEVNIKSGPNWLAAG